MVIVPHQDDEILMCAGILYEAAQKKIPAAVVMVTNGDYGSRDYRVGRSRLRETLAGLSLLGIGKESVEFLGYADTGMPKEESFLSRLYDEKESGKRYPSYCSEETYGLEDKEDYHKRKWGSHAPYDREHFMSDLRSVILDFRPDMIFTTSEFDAHGDHSALFFAVRDILAEMRGEWGSHGAPVLYSGIVHSLAGDDNWPVKTFEVGPYTMPEAFEETSGLCWEDRVSFGVPQCMKIENRKENLKYRALSCHVTALKPDAADFLFSFIKNEELFWEINF